MNLWPVAKIQIKEATKWFNANGFILNESKTKNILFNLKHIETNHLQFNYQDSAIFLGLFIDNTLNWNNHIDYISSKLSRVIFLLRRLTQCLEAEHVRTAYFAHFQSIIWYGLVLWGGSSRLSDILILQKRAVRVISGSRAMEHCRPIFVNLRIQTVVNLYILDLGMYALNNPNLLLLNSGKHNYHTRNKNKVSIGFYRLSKSLNSHLVLSLKVYNHLLGLICKYDLKTFSKNFYKWLLVNPFYNLNEFFSTTNVTF